MGALIDLTGKNFGKLTVTERVFIDSGDKGAYWKCLCECTGIKIVKSKNLIGGKTTHCGCVNKHETHGKSKHRLYIIWMGMKARCKNPNSPDFINYGGRGIKVCDEWGNSFISFYNWAMNNEYEDDLSIDRINVDGDYEVNNCKWSTKSQQQNNKRNTLFIEIDGITKSISDWSELYKINKKTLLNRYNRGLRGKDLLKVSNHKYISFDKKNNKWVAKYRHIDGRLHHVGYFKELDEAIIKQEEYKKQINLT